MQRFVTPSVEASCSCSSRVAVMPRRVSRRHWNSTPKLPPARTAMQSATLGVADLPPERPDAKEAWQRLQLLRRQQDVAVAEENYTMAAALRDEVRAQVLCLPPVQQYLYRQVSLLRTGNLHEKLQAIKAMVEAGDAVVISELATCLADPHLVDITYEAMWSLFMRNSDPEINGLMVEGMSLMSSPATQERALAVFTDMIRRAPNFPEAYNKRATVLYAMKRFEDSIADCRTVLRMQPWHFGAASGMGLCYLMLSREAEAAEAFELALSIHPGMNDIARVLKELKRRLARAAAGAAAEQVLSQESGQGPQEGTGGSPGEGDAEDEGEAGARA